MVRRWNNVEWLVGGVWGIQVSHVRSGQPCGQLRPKKLVGVIRIQSLLNLFGFVPIRILELIGAVGGGVNGTRSCSQGEINLRPCHTTTTQQSGAHIRDLHPLDILDLGVGNS